MQAHALFPDLDVAAVVDAYLAEGIDVDGEGCLQTIVKPCGSGGACSVGDTTNHKYGPYMKKLTLEPDPFKNSSALEVVAAGNLVMTATAGDPGGYKYDSKTGKVIINIAAEQDR